MTSDWTSLHALIHTTLRQRSLLPKGQSILIAVSGGQDSLCLLKILSDLQPKWSWKLAIAHCDHGWTFDAGMAAHVKKVAKSFKLPFYLKSIKNLKETEEEARKWRYEALIDIARERQFTTVTVGHTQSDRSETLLYNLIRGSGMDGLQALRWNRPLTSDLNLVRPLLGVSRRQTLAFCQQFNLPIWEDIVNQDLKYVRNRLRNEIIPYLQSHFNPQVETVLGQTAEILQAEVAYLEAVAADGLSTVISEDEMGLNRGLLRQFPLAIQRRIIKQFLSQRLPKHPNFEQIEAVIKLITSPPKSKTSSFSSHWVAEVQGEWIILYQLQ